LPQPHYSIAGSSFACPGSILKEHKMIWNRLLAIVFCVTMLGLISLEAYFRYAGYGSYPIYDIGDEIKYIPAANQHGNFLNRNAWYFNDRHMGNISNWRREKHPNVLLIGNSIVFGGNPFNHDDKLGPILEKDLGAGYAVWSVAAGNWSNVNEMAYLDRNPDVLQNADTVIFEYMSGGLFAASPWPGDYVFPQHKPLLLTNYIFRKYVLPSLHGFSTTEFDSLPKTGVTDAAQLERFKTLVSSISKDRKVVILLYPPLDELHDRSRWLRETAEVRELCQGSSVTCVDVAQEPAWTENAYSDDGIHPTIAGNIVLASILARVVTNKTVTKMNISD
jgi:lysophospholipase L1-like esterase